MAEPVHFFVIGAQRSGTTYLARLLEEHPQIAMARPGSPEPKHFLSESEVRKGTGYYERRYFAHATEGQIRGEKSTSYYEREEVAARIASDYPAARLLLCLRDPVERALSNYFFTRSNGIETRTLLETFIEDRPPPAQSIATSVSPFDYVRRGFYLQFIKSYLRHFPSAQLLPLVMYETAGDLLGVQGVFRFLGVDSSYVPESLSRVLNQGNEGPVPAVVITRLREIYKQPNHELAEFLGRPLLQWK